jgi:hypothetical protein
MLIDWLYWIKKHLSRFLRNSSLMFIALHTKLLFALMHIKSLGVDIWVGVLMGALLTVYTFAIAMVIQSANEEERR